MLKIYALKQMLFVNNAHIFSVSLHVSKLYEVIISFVFSLFSRLKLKQIKRATLRCTYEESGMHINYELYQIHNYAFFSFRIFFYHIYDDCAIILTLNEENGNE